MSKREWVDLEERAEEVYDWLLDHVSPNGCAALCLFAALLITLVFMVAFGG